jgi:hypothetical protein
VSDERRLRRSLITHSLPSLWAISTVRATTVLSLRLRAEPRLRDDVALGQAALQNERDGICARLADRRLRLARRLGRDVDAEFAIRQADAQPDARFAVLDRDGGGFASVEGEGNLEPRGEGWARRRGMSLPSVMTGPFAVEGSAAA